MAFFLSGTRVAGLYCGAKLNARAVRCHRDMCDEDYFSVDDYKEPVKGQKIMKLVTRKMQFSTQGNSEIINLTNTVINHLKGANLNSGLVNLFIPGATGGLTTMEYEPGLIEDFRRAFERIAPEEADYFHNSTHEDSNAHSHIRASLIGPSLSIPFENAILQLGKWQQIVFIDFDNRSRKREILLQIIGEK